MTARRETIVRSRCLSRHGVAAVEFALVTPLLVLLLLGAIDAGQLINASQKVSCASRKGARVAARFETQSESEVRASVIDYLEGAFPNASGLGSAAQVTVTDAGGAAAPQGDLTSIQPGSPLIVNVTLPYDTVRWIRGLGYLGGRSLRTATNMRRE